MNVFRTNQKIYKATCRDASNYACQNAIKKRLEDNKTDIETDNKIDNPRYIKVFPNNPLLVATLSATAGFDTTLIVAANDNDPQAGAKSGYVGLEADLYRFTNISIAKTEYPIRYGELIYIPEITIMKDFNGKTLKITPQISVALLPIIRKPNIITKVEQGEYIDVYSNDGDRTYIEKQLYNAFKLGGDLLVMDDIGCPLGHPKGELLTILNNLIAQHSKSVFMGIPDAKDSTYNYFNKNLVREI